MHWPQALTLNPNTNTITWYISSNLFTYNGLKWLLWWWVSTNEDTYLQTATRLRFSRFLKFSGKISPLARFLIPWKWNPYFQGFQGFPRYVGTLQILSLLIFMSQGDLSKGFFLKMTPNFSRRRHAPVSSKHKFLNKIRWRQVPTFKVCASFFTDVCVLFRECLNF